MHGLRSDGGLDDIGDRNRALPAVGPGPVAVKRLLRVEGALVFGANCIPNRILWACRELGGPAAIEFEERFGTADAGGGGAVRLRFRDACCRDAGLLSTRGSAVVHQGEPV